MLSFPLFLVGSGIPALGQVTTRSQNDPRPVAKASPREGQVTIDGALDDAAWAKATPITELVQSSPDEGKPPSQRTELRFLYDEGAIYIGARMYDSLGAKGVRSVLARRDQVMNGDNNLTSDKIAFVFDTFRDKNSRTWFELNPDGVKGDHQNGDASYDPVWEGSDQDRFARLDRGIPDSAFAAPILARRRPGLGDAGVAQDRSAERV